MGMDLGLARQQLSGKRKKSFEQKLKEKNARKTARRRGVKRRKQLEETKPLLSSNTVFYGILAILLIIVVYIAPSPFKSAEDTPFNPRATRLSKKRGLFLLTQRSCSCWRWLRRWLMPVSCWW